MPKQVEAALVKIFDSYEKEDINGKLFFGQLKKEKRFWLESWS
jgi:sulfite reductase alpha subunit-like flavoprotein